MKNKYPLNFLLMFLSAVTFCFLISLGQISPNFNAEEFLKQCLRYITAYLVVYLFVFLLFGNREKILDLSSIIATALVGTLMMQILKFYNSLNDDLLYLSTHQDELYSRHVESGIEAFCFLSIMFIAVCSIITGIVKLVINWKDYY